MKKKVLWLILIISVSPNIFFCRDYIISIFQTKDNILLPLQNERIAYYVDNGNDGYDKQNTIPIGNYVINEEKSKCLGGGTISDYNSSQGTIKYILKGSDKCSVYFDELRTVTLNMGTVAISSGGTTDVTMEFDNNNILAYKLLSDNLTTYSTATNSGLVKDTIYGNMFRYQSNVDRTCSVESDTCKNNSGTYFNTEDNTNNYVCFGYSNVSDCTGANKDDYLYRIIGIDKDTKEVQVIKATGIKEGSTTTFNYHNSNVSTDWGAGMTNPQADISMRLNGTHTTLSNIFVNSTEYPYMAENSTWYNKISSHNWKSGTSSSLQTYNGNTAYTYESSFSTTSPMKIGLLNNSDVFWGYTGGIPGNYTTNKANWLYSDVGAVNTYEWAALRISSISAWYLFGSSSIVGYLDSGYVTRAYRVRPSFYLISDISWTGGSGTKLDPFIVG